MGAITDKLNAEWSELTVDQNMFAIRAAIENLYNNLVDAITEGNQYYPTGDTTFDNYVGPIVTELTNFKNQLETDYGEFINWRQP